MKLNRIYYVVCSEFSCFLTYMLKCFGENAVVCCKTFFPNWESKSSYELYEVIESKTTKELHVIF